MPKFPKLKLDQKISIWGIAIPALISLFALFKVEKLEVKVNPVIEMKPKIVNVIKNVTEVKKEIANLQEMVKQQDELWESATFSKSTLNERIVKINNPDTSNPNRAAFVFVELDKIPLVNSLRVSTESGMLASSIYRTDRNILMLKYLRSVDHILDQDTDFIKVAFIPDVNATEKLRTVKDMTREFTAEGASFNFKLKESTVKTS